MALSVTAKTISSGENSLAPMPECLDEWNREQIGVEPWIHAFGRALRISARVDNTWNIAQRKQGADNDDRCAISSEIFHKSRRLSLSLKSIHKVVVISRQDVRWRECKSKLEPRTLENTGTKTRFTRRLPRI